MAETKTFKRIEAKKALAGRKLEADTQRILKNQRRLISGKKPKKQREKSVNGGLFQINFSI